MKSKGAIRFFAIALAIVCLYELSFTFVSQGIYSDAEAIGATNPQAKTRYLDSLKSEVVMDIGLKKYTYSQVRSRKINLGLDLRGGMHVTLEVAQDKLLTELSGKNTQPEFVQAIAKAKEIKITSNREFVDIFNDELHRIKPSAKLASYFGTSSNSSIRLSSTDAEVKTFLKESVNSAFGLTFDVLRTRIDQFGVTQPTINPDPATGRILVELPGADDPDRIRNLLKKAAKLEFFRVYTVNLLADQIESADKLALTYFLTESAKNKANDPATIAALKKDSTTNAKLDSLDKQLKIFAKDSAKVASINEQKKSVRDTKTAADYPLLSLMNITTEMFQQESPAPYIGSVLSKDTGRVREILSIPTIRDQFPSDITFAFAAKPLKETDLYQLYALKGDAALDGDKVIDASQDIDPQSNSFVVSMRMNSVGATDWAALTKSEAEKTPKGHIAIVLDGQVYSAPRVDNEIANGSSQITGSFTSEDSKDLANVLKAGKLPVELEIVDQAVVGPSLGAQAIQSGLLSLLISVVAILLFMMLYYNIAGIVANIAVLINLYYIIGVLTSMQAALTLPGMAGIVLTLAMAVDANVLIYERIREELKAGKVMRLAISDGFKHALPSIIDGNLTTLLIAIILMIFGKGPIFGFAIVLFIGILTSLFCAILLSRLIFEWFLKKDRKITFGNKRTNNFLTNINYDFVGKRKIGYVVSIILLVVAVASLAINGLNYAVEFKGGYSYTVNFKGDAPNLDNVRSGLRKTFGSNPEVKTFGDANTLIITTDYLLEANSDKTDSLVKNKLIEGLGASGFKITADAAVSPALDKNPYNASFASLPASGLLAQSTPATPAPAPATPDSPAKDGTAVATTEDSLAKSASADSPLVAPATVSGPAKSSTQNSYGDITILSTNKVTSTIASDVRSSAFFSIIFGLLAVFGYVVIRFRRWQFALGATAALAHDAIVILGLFSLFKNVLPFMDVDQAIIAAILTVIGYSVNDTVVVFDRIREYLKGGARQPMIPTVNSAINKTLNRTVITSLTVILVAAILLVFGGPVIRGFSFAMLIGVLLGTYSSIFVATPIAVDLQKKEDREHFTF